MPETFEFVSGNFITSSSANLVSKGFQGRLNYIFSFSLICSLSYSSGSKDFTSEISTPPSGTSSTFIVCKTSNEFSLCQHHCGHSKLKITATGARCMVCQCLAKRIKERNKEYQQLNMFSLLLILQRKWT